MVLACASMLFSTNSAMASSGLLCENAMIRIAFQSSPIRNLPLSDSFDFAALIFAAYPPASSDNNLADIGSCRESEDCNYLGATLGESGSGAVVSIRQTGLSCDKGPSDSMKLGASLFTTQT